jgi:hypothetical protein
MKRPGADLVAHYLDPDRLSVGTRWSRKHAHTQRRLCERFALPAIGTVACQDLRTAHLQKIMNSPATAGEGHRVHTMISALLNAGLQAGYLVGARLATVHWRAGNDLLPAPSVSVAEASLLWVDPAEIPGDADVGRLARALCGDPDTTRHADPGHHGKWARATSAWPLTEQPLAVRTILRKWASTPRGGKGLWKCHSTGRRVSLTRRVLP